MNAAIPTNRTSHCISCAGRIAGTAALALCLLRPIVVATPAFAMSQSEDAGQTQSVTPRLRLRIAVDQFKWNETRGDYNFPHDLREGLQALLIERLQQSGRFQVMEREITARLQASDEDEIARQKRESLPAGSAAAQARPRQHRTPAQFIITPTVTGWQEASSGDNGFNLGGILKVGGKKAKTTLSINLRISDAETSETIDSVTANGDSESKGGDISINLGGISGGKSDNKQAALSKVVSACLNDAVTKISARLAKEPWYALVAGQDATTHRVILAAGSEAGIAAGMEFAVNKTGEPVRDPESGDVLSRGDETPIGRIRIVRVERNVAYADVVSGSGFGPGNMVRQ